MRTLILGITSAAVFCLAGNLTAQNDGSQSQSSWMPPNIWGGYGVYGGFGGGHASTAEEGALRGMADVTRSAGAANLMNSEASKNWMQGQRMYIENRQYGTETYFNMRETNRKARAAEAGPRPTREDLQRYSQARMPDRLSVSELDPLTGQINWPMTLRDDPYSQQRETLNAMYQQRAAAGGYLNAEQRAEVKKVTESMKAELKANISSYSPNEYLQAKKFIEGLDYELYAPTS